MSLTGQGLAGADARVNSPKGKGGADADAAPFSHSSFRAAQAACCFGRTSAE